MRLCVTADIQSEARFDTDNGIKLSIWSEPFGSVLILIKIVFFPDSSVQVSIENLGRDQIVIR